MLVKDALISILNSIIVNPYLEHCLELQRADYLLLRVKLKCLRRLRIVRMVAFFPVVFAFGNWPSTILF